MRRRAEEEEEAGAPEWMVTYSDSITLLVTFFVLLLTFSSIEAEDFSNMASAIVGWGKTGVMDPSRNPKRSLSAKERLQSGRFKNEGSDIPSLSTDPSLDYRLGTRSREDLMRFKRIGRARVLSVPSSAVFLGESSSLSVFGKKLVDQVGAYAGTGSHDVIVCEDSGERTGGGALHGKRSRAVITRLVRRSGVEEGRVLLGSELLGGGAGGRTLEIALAPHRERP